MNLTSNFLDATIADSQGLPTFVDDASAASTLDLTTPIYSISSSLAKGRCNGEGKPNSRLKFSGAVVFTSEKSLLAQTTGQPGLYARIFEFCRSWYRSGEEAEAVTEIAQKYNGTAWIPFMKSMFSQGGQCLIDRYRAEYSALITSLKSSDGLQRRLLQKAAVLLTAIPYVIEAWGFTLDRDAILQILTETFQESIQNEPPVDSLHDSLMAEIAAHKNYFPQKNAPFHETYAAWGEIGNYREHPCIWITRSKFCELVKKYGYSMPKNACKILYDAHLMAQFSGNHYFRLHKVAGITTECCALYEAVPTAPPKKLKKKKSEIFCKSLLEDEPEMKGNEE